MIILRFFIYGMIICKMMTMAVTAYPLTEEMIARDYGNNPEELTKLVNEYIPATGFNCQDISEWVFKKMKRYQHAELICLGVVKGDGNGHRVVVWKEWGDWYMISSPWTVAQIRRKEGTKLYRMSTCDTLEDICWYIFRNATGYYKYQSADLRYYTYTSLRRSA